MPAALPSPRLLLWGLAQIARHGLPRRLVHTYVGVGDELLAASALRIAHEQGSDLRGTWFLVRYPALHAASTLPARFIPWDARLFQLVRRLRRPVVELGYSHRDEAAGRDVPVPGHALANFCRQLGVSGPVPLRPTLELAPDLLAAGRLHPRQIVVQSSSQGARIPIPAKHWPLENMQAVVDGLRDRGLGEIVQIGTLDEPPLRGVHDLRGKLSLPQAAAVLARSALFIGLPGGLMHLARAVDCPAVIIYGGRESPDFAGYSANANLVDRPACSPCYLIVPCPHGLPCMHAVTPSAVLDAALAQLARGRPLPVDTATP